MENKVQTAPSSRRSESATFREPGGAVQGTAGSRLRGVVGRGRFPGKRAGKLTGLHFPACHGPGSFTHAQELWQDRVVPGGGAGGRGLILSEPRSSQPGRAGVKAEWKACVRDV